MTDNDPSRDQPQPKAKANAPSRPRGVTPGEQRRVERRAKRKAVQRRRLFLYVGISAAIILLTGAFIWKRHGIFRHFQALQTGRLVTEANEAIDRGDHAAATEKIKRAATLKPRDPEVLRAIADLQEETNPRDAAVALNALNQSGKADFDDRLRLLELHVANERFSSADPLARELLARHPDNPRILFLSGITQHALGNRDAALDFFLKAKQLAPDELEFKLAHAQAKLESPLSDIREVAWQSIFDVAKRDPEGLTGLQALRTIYTNRRQLIVPLDKYFELFKNNPYRPSEADPTITLLMWEFDLHFDSKRKEARARDAIDAWVEADLDPRQLDIRLGWLNSQGFSNIVSEFLAIDDAAGADPDLLASTFQVLTLRKEFDKAEQLVEQLRETGRKAVAEACRACLWAAQQKPQAEVDDKIRHAVLLASREDTPDNLLRIGYMALGLERDEEARHAFELAVQAAPLQAHRALASLADRQNNLDALCAHLGALVRIMPSADNEGTHAHLAYLRLLLKTDLDAATTAAQRLLAAKPADPEYQLLLAFAHLRSREIEQAAESARGIDPAQLADRHRAVLVAIALSSGNKEAADALIPTIETTALHPEEMKLLDPEEIHAPPPPGPNANSPGDPLRDPNAPNPYLPARTKPWSPADDKNTKSALTP